MASEQVTGPLVDLILSDDSTYPYETIVQQIDTKNVIKMAARPRYGREDT